MKRKRCQVPFHQSTLKRRLPYPMGVKSPLLKVVFQFIHFRQRFDRFGLWYGRRTKTIDLGTSALQSNSLTDYSIQLFYWRLCQFSNKATSWAQLELGAFFCPVPRPLSLFHLGQSASGHVVRAKKRGLDKNQKLRQNVSIFCWREISPWAARAMGEKLEEVVSANSFLTQMLRSISLIRVHKSC